ncbi:MAG: hypothetical protein AAF721_08440 [Myxococcota bacterium]
MERVPRNTRGEGVMKHGIRFASFFAALALACSGGAPDPRQAPKAGITQPAQDPPTAAPDPEARAKPAEPVAAPEPTPEPEVAEPLRMHPVALRQGDLDGLVVQGGHVFVDLGGLPVPVGPDGRPTYRKELVQGLGRASFGRRIEAIAVDADGEPTWITTYESVGRGWPRFDVYRHDGKRWRSETKRRGPLIAHYQAYVRTGEATFGLRAHHGNPKPRLASARFRFEGGWTNAAAEKRFEASEASVRKALSNNPPVFEALAGTDGPAPTIPTRAAWSDVVADGRGNVYAVTVARPKSDQRLELLLWAPGSTAPQTVALPGLADEDRATDLRLAAAGDKVLVYGGVRGPKDYRVYLALGSGAEWETLPTDAVGDALDPHHLFAAVDPTGEVRVVGEWWKLWRRAPDGTWREVQLPLFEAAGHEPLRADGTLRVAAVAWGAGAWWALGHEGDERSYGTDEPITAVYSSVATATEEIVELPDEPTVEGHRG